MSETGKLAAALSKAQGQMRGAKKDAENPFFKSSYANLSSVWEACREALSQNELAVSQVTEIGETGTVLKTILMHSSGEQIIGIMPIMIGEKATAQQLGSAITYARRYALSAIVGVAPEDDDGNSASETQVAAPKKSGAAKWAETDPSLDGLKKDAAAFSSKLDDCETIYELTRLVDDNADLLKKLERLPEWLNRAKAKIAQCKEAFKLAD